MIFLINKTSNDSDQDLNEILGGIFTLLLQIFMNVEFLLYTKRSQTKTNMFKNKKGLNKAESDTKINNNYIVSNSKNIISKFGNNDDSSSEDDDFFNPETGEVILGDIVLSVPRILSQAEEYGHSVLREYAFLIAHSMLHLFGFDHMTESDASVMEQKQREILDILNISRD